MTLKSPYPYHGGKSRIADLVWDRIGKVNTYIEPFFGGGSMLLANPHPAKCEIINDSDGYVTNFWRALHADPERLAELSCRAVDEIDLNAANIYLKSLRGDLTERMRLDLNFHDVDLAGLWAWGQSAWIQGGFAHTKWATRPYLGNQGVHRGSIANCTYAERLRRTRGYFIALQDRMHGVKRMCGDWSRCIGPAVTKHKPPCGIFLDPPYSNDLRRSGIYACDDGSVATDVCEWAMRHEGDSDMRIVVCGMKDEHQFSDNWIKVDWKTNASHESIWFSPSCGRELELFNIYEDAE